MATTIQISEGLQDELVKRKFYDRESYEEVIWDLIEDSLELSAETKKELEEAREQIKTGKVHFIEQIKQKYKLK